MSPVGTVSSFNVKYLLKPLNMRQFSTQIAQNLPDTDRNETVEIVSNFYIFLTTHGFLPASAIKAHSEGWPGENCGAFRKMGKSDEVVDLLSYLPLGLRSNRIGSNFIKVRFDRKVRTYI
jgi:hypothetical protein